MEKVLGVAPRQAASPTSPRRPSTPGRSENGYVQAEPGGEAVLFQTCFVQHNETAARPGHPRGAARNGVDVRVVKGLRCCGMPAWEHGDLEALRARPTATSTCSPLRGARGQGAGGEPHLLDDDAPGVAAPARGADRARAEKLAAAVMDVSEYLWSLRNEPRFSADFKCAPPGGRVAYHAPCHLRAQGGRLQGARPAAPDPRRRGGATVMECCGHDGTYAMTVEGLRALAAASARRPSTG